MARKPVYRKHSRRENSPTLKLEFMSPDGNSPGVVVFNQEEGCFVFKGEKYGKLREMQEGTAFNDIFMDGSCLVFHFGETGENAFGRQIVRSSRKRLFSKKSKKTA